MVGLRNSVALIVTLLLAGSIVSAQEIRKLKLSPRLPTAFGIGAEDEEIALTATFERAAGTNRGRLHVKAVIAEGWHLYSVTQPAGGPQRTTLSLADNAPAKLLGPFTPDAAPNKSTPKEFNGALVEDHVDQVTWTAPVQFTDPDKAVAAAINLKIVGQACKDQKCLPIEQELAAKFIGTYKPDEGGKPFRDKDSVVEWTISVKPAKAKPGDDVELVIRADVDEGYHLYQSATKDANFSTVMVVTKKPSMRVGPPKASTDPVSAEQQIPGQPEIAYHQGDVTWTLPIQIEKNAEAGEHPLEAVIGYQACTDSSCMERRGLHLRGTISVGDHRSENSAPAQIKAVEYLVVAESATQQGPWVDDLSATVGTVRSLRAGMSLPLALALGLLGGLILNLMPCVLPVIGLKVMSFVEQAGEHRGRIMTLNLWYTLGLLSVFWALAGVAIGFRVFYGESFSWGEQYTYIGFRLGLMVFVFAMALSFLGTWEIPLPGFATSSVAGEAQRKEGASGAFAKGVFSTILATPCSGPFLGPVFGFMLTQSNAVIFAVFTAIGLGMALPYLLIGAFPSLIAWLPKPGDWMENLKQGLSFFLLGTVVYLFAGVPESQRAAVFGMLIAVWFGCWIIGRVPTWESLQKRYTAWGTGISAAVLLSLAMFKLLIPAAEIMKWEPYTEAKLASLQRQGKTVMVDFTANWCPSCIYNFNRVLNTVEMAQVFAKYDVVPMKADWSEPNDEIKSKLAELNSNSIPLLAIYPAGDPRNPIVLPDVLTQQKVKAALQQATGLSDTQHSASVQTASRR